jgi:hypothetical protein
MTLRDITREAVLAAIAEYDRLGQDEFLSKYGFDRARSYLLIHDGKAYDSKAIVGVAHGFLPGEQALAARNSAARLVRLLTNLNVYYSDGLPALCQPITPLWAISRADRGLSPGTKRNGRSPRWCERADVFDNPVQMIAPCPNRHTIKTHGRSREQLRCAASPLDRHAAVCRMASRLYLRCQETVALPTCGPRVLRVDEGSRFGVSACRAGNGRAVHADFAAFSEHDQVGRRLWGIGC